MLNSIVIWNSPSMLGNLLTYVLLSSISDISPIGLSEESTSYGSLFLPSLGATLFPTDGRYGVYEYSVAYHLPWENIRKNVRKSNQLKALMALQECSE